MQGPLQGFFPCLCDLVFRTAERPQPVRGNEEVLFLIVRIKRKPETETVGKGYFFLNRFTRMQIAIFVMGISLVVGHFLREKMPSV